MPRQCVGCVFRSSLLSVYIAGYSVVCFVLCFFFQAEDGIRDLVRSRGLGDVYKRQPLSSVRRSSICLMSVSVCVRPDSVGILKLRV